MFDGRNAWIAYPLTLVGTGLARWSAGGVEVPRTPDARFAPMDLGDASLVWRERAYVYGCPGLPEFLTERCVPSDGGAGSGARAEDYATRLVRVVLPRG